VTPERFRLIQDVFTRTAEQPREERAGFLERVCAGDAELRAEVDSLLAAGDGPLAALLEQPAMAAISGAPSGARDAEAAASLERGSRLGPYEILDRVGEGGMGEVYRAMDPRLAREVAVKVLSAGFTGDADRMRRFAQEARAVGMLNHPNITAVYDTGSEGGVAYVVFELLEGETLRERLRRGALSQRKAVDYATQIARGLSAAHEKGIVHRDLKPENLFVGKDGRIRILDFGLAKLRPRAPGEDADRRTGAGMVLGTVGYMSPEQVRGEEADHRSDIFSFGSILYEMLAGRRAFRGPTPVETMNAILKDEPPEIGEESQALPASLERIVRHCLEKNREERFQSARDLSFALEALSGSSSQVGRVPAAARQRRVARGVRVAALLAAGAALGAALAILLRSPVSSEPAALRPLTYSGHDYSPAASPDGRTLAFVSDRDGVPRIWIKQLTAGGEVALTDGSDDFPRFSPDGASILFSRKQGALVSLFRVATVGGPARKLVDDAVDGDWSPDGREIAFVRLTARGGHTDSAVSVVGADGAGQREIARWEQQTLLHPRWSPDGKTIAVAESGFQQPGTPRRIFLVSADGKRRSSLSPPTSTNRLSSVAWTGDGRELVYSQALSDAAVVTQAPARIVRQDLRTGKTETIFRSATGSEILDILGPGRLVFDASSTRENLHEIRMGSSGSSRWMTRGASADRQPSYAPDGDWVVFSSNRSGQWNLWEVSTVTGALRRLTEGATTDWDPAFTRDGKRLLWSSNRSGHYEIWSAAADGSEPRQVTHDGVDAENPTETPGGGWIVYSSSNPAKSGIWKIHPDGSGATLLVAGSLAHPEVSPDGAYVAFQTVFVPQGVSIRVARVEDGALAPFDVELSGNQLVGRCRWLPDGRAIAFVGEDEHDVTGIFEEEFTPGRSPRGAPVPLTGFDAESPAESFGFSPDGRSVMIAGSEQLSSVMEAEGVAGVEAPRRPPRTGVR
jgi:Tol biopolymer transport system component